MKKITIIVFAFLLTANHQIFAQDNSLGPRDRVITTAVPFLLVPGDARASGMGDIGVSSTPDTYSQQWNPAKYAFIKQEQSVGLSYVPYLRKLASDINVGQINYHNRINERSAFAGSLRYFNLGEIESRQNPLEEGMILKPNQLAVDLSYALLLSETFSMAVTGRYIRSDLKLQTSFEDASAANSFSADVSGYYQSKEIAYSEFNGIWRAGFNISNIGPKIKYGDSEEGSFLPTNLGLGAGFDFILDVDNTVGAYVEFNKLLVPTPSDTNDDGVINREDDFYTTSPIGGMFSSLTDAPGGFSEELKEVTWALGAEYRYQETFALRAGYFHESEDKGYRQYATLGAGFKYSLAEINVSYLFNTASATNNPLEGSLRFSLAFNFGKLYD